MTLNDIIVSALAQLDRGHDGQTLDIWRDKFTHYANEAVLDIARSLRLRRSDTLEVKEGYIDTSELPRCCAKILRMDRENVRVPFAVGPSTTKIRVYCPDGPVLVQYRYLPNDMTSPSDVPGLPAACHKSVVTYVVARERASADPSMQRGANLYFEIYNADKRRLRAMLGEPDSYEFFNRW
ncbi:hypothetical protein LJC42_08820 [Eubacteriales bacterium OttesenSCG-928-K08]|nr:hypothetical protein [Eubacteriales bacterium OttesenSCG-928-K08]